jgi:hypothetical protein
MLGVLTLSGLVIRKFRPGLDPARGRHVPRLWRDPVLSLGLDGQPDAGLVTAMIAELVIGLAGLAALIAARKTA